MDTSKPRIIHIIDHFYPKLGYQETFLSNVETEQGYDVYVLTSNLYAKTIYEVNKEILDHKKIEVGLSVERGIKTIRLSAFHLPIVNKLYLRGMEEVVTKLGPDFIICHGIVFLTSLRVARLKKQLPEVKLIFDDHMTYNATRGGIFNYLYKFFKIVCTPAILKSANDIVAVTDETKEFMTKIYGIPQEKIKVIPLGVDTMLFRRDHTNREEIRCKYGIQDEDVVFMYAGKIIAEKGVHLLIEAALKIVHECPNVKIMIIGGDNHYYKNLLIRKIESSKYSNNFIWVPVVPNEELYKYYSAGDVGVWPLQCSMTMLEAMSCSLPVIISDNSGALERISEKNGLMYREGDVNDLLQKMKMIMIFKKRNDMGLKAREYAEKNDWNIISKKFLELVEISD